jgi:hypothetical protein
LGIGFVIFLGFWAVDAYRNGNVGKRIRLFRRAAWYRREYYKCFGMLGGVIAFGAIAYMALIWLEPYFPRQAISPFKGLELTDGVEYASFGRVPGAALTWLKPGPGGTAETSDGPQHLARLQSAKSITLFVHGHNAPVKTISTYFTATTRWLLPALGAEHALIVYDWPSWGTFLNEPNLEKPLHWTQIPNPVWTELKHYDYSRKNAASHGVRGLVELLSQVRGLNPTAHMDVVAHSMGCHVVHLAMSEPAFAGQQVRRVVWGGAPVE